MQCECRNISAQFTDSAMLQRQPAGQTEAAIEHGCLKVFYEKPSALYAF